MLSIKNIENIFLKFFFIISDKLKISKTNVLKL